MIGSAQVTIHISLWIYAIYVVDFKLIKEIFASNKRNELIFLFFVVFHQLTMFRYLFKAMYTTSEIKVNYVPKSEENEILGKLEQCKKCGLLRPPRSHHCSICESCINKMDHHCYILNTCIGRQNYKYFFAYLLFALINIIISLVLSTCSLFYYYTKFREIKGKQKIKKFVDIIFDFPLNTCLLTLFSVPSFVAVFYLFLYHLFLLYKGDTTIERRYPSLKKPKIRNKSFIDRVNSVIESNNWVNVYWID